MRMPLVRIALLLALAGTAGTALAQQAQNCPDGNPPQADLGIAGLRCHCSFKVEGKKARAWTFDDEPEIVAARSGSAADGRLMKGDRIVAIDDLLITTPEGGARWSSVQPGERIRLRVRRGGRVKTVELTVGARCNEDREQLAAAPVPEPLHKLPPVSELGRRLLPKGWLGLGLACKCAVNTSDDSPQWRFFEAPTITAVDPEGPAARAGLRAGDTLLRIDDLDLTTDAGGAAFSQIEPDQQIQITYRREGGQYSAQITATTRPTPASGVQP